MMTKSSLWSSEIHPKPLLSLHRKEERAVTAYLQSEAVTFVPWPAMSSDMNPIEHIWDMLGRRILAKEPPVQNIRPISQGQFLQ
jgi:transposase